MLGDKKDDISFRPKSEDGIIIQPKPKPKRESIEILTTTEKAKKIMERIKPLHFLTICLSIIGVFILFAILRPSVKGENKLANETMRSLLKTKQTLVPKPSFIIEKQVLQMDLLEAMVKNNKQLPFSWEIISELEEILSWSVGLSKLKKGDIIYCVWGLTENGHRKEDIAGLILKISALDTILMAIQFEAKGKIAAYYDRNGCPVERQFLQSPVRYGRVSSRYNLTRLNPVLGIIKPHQGTDFAAPMGEPIYALAAGVVERQGYTSGNGNYVKLRHDSIYSTTYLHMSRFVEGQAIGDTVHQGTVIGLVGSTGQSTGPHVCLRFWRKDKQRDFVKYHPYLPSSPSLPYNERKRFLQSLDSILIAIGLPND